MQTPADWFPALIRCGLTDATLNLPVDFSLEGAARLAYQHHVSGVVYTALCRAGADMLSPVMRDLLTRTGRAVSVCETQTMELDKLTAVFAQHGVDFLPLKGVILRSLYPDPSMREMGDVDILIRVEQYPMIASIMEEMGYVFRTESDHEYIWKKPGLVTVELHKHLIPSYNTDYYAYFGDGWERAVAVDGCPGRYTFSTEDTYVFLFAHFAKHYRAGGIGVKQVMDLWLYRQANGDMDTSYVASCLSQLRLDVFHRHVVAMLDVWFADGTPTPQTEELTRFIVDSGAYGTAQGHAQAEALREAQLGTPVDKVQANKWRSALFPPRSVIAASWPVVDKVPLLLPFFWIVRGLRAVFFRRRSMKVRLNKVRDMTPQSIQTYEQRLQLVGLDFHGMEEQA
ncbi:MAG: nucleotidyltransferase family protein [Clostridia bacterium]|nr:nucleotidyltransferase family protein [Clostridia bacterium]